MTFTLTATISGVTSAVTKTAVIVPPAGTIDPVSANNSAADTDLVIYRLWLPLVAKQPGDSLQWQVALGYEDLSLVTGLNDFDYNDWVVQISSTVSYSTTSPGRMQKLDMYFIPRARGGGYYHTFQMRFPAQALPSDGTAVLTIYDQNRRVISTQTQAYHGNAENVFDIFQNTSTVFPGGPVNVVEGAPLVPPQRFADLSITFDTPFVFDVPAAGLSLPHGQGLFFDPTLLVLNTGDEIHVGDLRLLSVPISNWLWPEEGVRIDRAYPGVVYVPGSPPSFSFSPLWWTNFNHCVYDGQVCGTP